MQRRNKVIVHELVTFLCNCLSSWDMIIQKLPLWLLLPVFETYKICISYGKKDSMDVHLGQSSSTWESSCYVGTSVLCRGRMLGRRLEKAGLGSTVYILLFCTYFVLLTKFNAGMAWWAIRAKESWASVADGLKQIALRWPHFLWSWPWNVSCLKHSILGMID